MRISETHNERMRRNRADGRTCWVRTGDGCFNRATRRITHESWSRRKAPTVSVVTACARHAEEDWLDGANFRAVKVEAF